MSTIKPKQPTQTRPPVAAAARRIPPKPSSPAPSTRAVGAKKPPTVLPQKKTPTTLPPATKKPPTTLPQKKTPTTVASKPPTTAPAAQQPTPPQPQGGANWINRTVQNSVAGVGNYAGGFVNSIGDTVNKFGQGIGGSITNTTRYWGQGVAGYGNNIKDSVDVGGPRISTAGNPLGMAGMGSAKGALPGGKAAEGGVRRSGGGSAGNPLGI